MMRLARLHKLFCQSPFRRGDQQEKQESSHNSVKITTHVNDEYEKAFRTKSYVEMYNRFKNKTPSEKSPSLPLHPSSPLLSSSPSKPFHPENPPSAFEPHCGTLFSSPLQISDLDQALVGFFDTSFEAGLTCESLLEDVIQIQANHSVMMNILNKPIEHDSLASLPKLSKPFTSVTPEMFSELHETHLHLFRDLTSQCRKAKKRSKLRKYIKRAVATFLLLGSGALAAALIIILTHSLVGVLAAPGLLALLSLAIFLIKRCIAKKKKPSKGLIEQLDLAARGVFTMVNDFASLGQHVTRLNGDIKRHKKGLLADHDDEMLIKGAAKIFQKEEATFLEELEELKNQTILCLLDIKRSRNQVSS